MQGERRFCPACRGSSFTPICYKTGSWRKVTYTLVRCNECRLAFVTDPSIDLENIYGPEYYRRLGAEKYVDYVSEAELGERSLRTYEFEGIARLIESQKPLGPSIRWLDYGSGTGGLVRFIQENGLGSARGFDITQEALSTETVDELAGRFDVVTAIEVLEHALDPREIVERVAALLKPGGIFFFTTGNAAKFEHDLEHWHYFVPEIHINLFEPRSMDMLLRAYGLLPRYLPFQRGHEGLVRYKALKTLGFQKRNLFESALPWNMVSRLINQVYGVSGFPIGVKAAD